MGLHEHSLVRGIRRRDSAWLPLNLARLAIVQPSEAVSAEGPAYRGACGDRRVRRDIALPVDHQLLRSVVGERYRIGHAKHDLLAIAIRDRGSYAELRPPLFSHGVDPRCGQGARLGRGKWCDGEGTRLYKSKSVISLQ
jgi:hypothetical protein